MKVVIVGGNLPYPATSGNRIRTLNLTVRLAQRHEVTFLATRNSDRAEAREALAYLGDHKVEAVEVGPGAPRKSGPAFYARLAANLASPLPYSVASHHSPELDREVRRRAAAGRVDLWQAEWAGGMEALRRLDGANTLVMAHNVETLIWERYAEAEPNPVRRWYIGGQCRKFDRFERVAFAAAGRVVAVSPDDAAVVRDRFGVPAERVDVVDNGIDRAYFESIAAGADRDPRRILFLGSLEWRPNLDAVGLLLDRLFPAVREAEPGATLDVVGRNPPEALVRRIAETPGVALHANVPDVRPFLARAGVMAVPLRVGGGSRLKILEALAAGLPVVSTRVGAEGLCLTPDEDAVIVDDADAVAPALVDALRDPARVRAQAERGRDLVLRRYDWDVLADALERSWERCAGSPAAAV
jgi:glycosyltransferase involved in cell wall biosynthesis